MKAKSMVLKTIKKLVDATVEMIFRIIPATLRRRVAVSCIHAERHEPAQDALAALLTLDSIIYGITGRKSIEYNGGVHVKHRLTDYHDFFVDRIKSGECVLDIGCGKGELDYNIVNKSGAVVVGVDKNPDSLAFARKHFQHPRLEFIESDALEFNSTQAFNTIVLSNVLEHIEQRVEFLQRVIDKIHPQRILIRVPMFNRDWRVPLRKELGLAYFSDSTHYTEYTQESFTKEMEAAGLRIMHMEIRWGEIWAEVLPDA